MGEWRGRAAPATPRGAASGRATLAAMPHSVRRHLRVEIDAYDRAIRSFVPGYEEMLRAAAREIAAAAGGGPILELGAGSGAFSEALLEHREVGAVELVDADAEMLARARARLARFGDRARFREASFDDPFPPCAAAAASLALHHVPTLDGKRALYRRIGAALPPGGVFVNADVTMPAAPAARAAAYRRWTAHMAAHGVDEAQARRHFAEWSEEDTYFPLEDELAAMTEAGFAARQVWSETPISVLAGRKPAAARSSASTRRATPAPTA